MLVIGQVHYFQVMFYAMLIWRVHRWLWFNLENPFMVNTLQDVLQIIV